MNDITAITVPVDIIAPNDIWPSAGVELTTAFKCVFFSWSWIKYLWISLLQGAVSIRKTVLPGMAIPMLKIRRPNGRLIFNMEIAIRR